MGRMRILPYPRLTNTAVQLDLGADVHFTYFSQGEKVEAEEIKAGQCRIVSPGWRPRLDELTVKARVTIEHPEVLFRGRSSISSCEVACEGAQIGIALKWVLPESKIRGVEVSETLIGAFDGEQALSLVLEKTFAPSMVRNKAEFSVELFLAKPCEDEENIYARIVGSELASLGGIVLYTGGSGGMFPICSRAAGSASPLWELDINISDMEDLDRDFSSDVCVLNFNSDHKLYSDVVRTDISGGVSPLMFEIFSECCVMFFLRVKKTLEEYNCIEELDGQPVSKDDGTSTLDAMRYMKKLLFPTASANDLFCAEVEELSKMVRIGLQKNRLKSAVAAENEEEAQ